MDPAFGTRGEVGKGPLRLLNGAHDDEEDETQDRRGTEGVSCPILACSFSNAFLAPNLVKAAIEGRLPRGIGVERLRDPPTEWSRQFEALGLNPE